MHDSYYERHASDITLTLIPYIFYNKKTSNVTPDHNSLDCYDRREGSEGRRSGSRLPSQSIYGFREDVWHGRARPLHHVVRQTYPSQPHMPCGHNADDPSNDI